MVYLPAKNAEPLSGFHIVIHADRDIRYPAMMVVIPLLLIVAMSWLVFWIDPKESGSQISVAITAVLTLGVAQKLPGEKGEQDREIIFGQLLSG